MSRVYVKQVNLDNIVIDFSEVNAERKNYINRLKGNRKIISYLSWLFLKEIVLKEYNLNVDELNLSYNEYNKPLFKEFFFNISHSNNVIAIGISNKEIGVDVQLVSDSINFLLKEVKKDLNKYELTKLFSASEAYYKKIGTGLNRSFLKENVFIEKQELIKFNSDEYILSISHNDTELDIIYN